MKKKLLMRLAAAALAVGMCLSSAGASYFTDVSPNAWYYDAVTECSDYGLLNGYQNGTFRPNATITRAECAALLDRMVDPDDDDEWTTWFRDRLSRCIANGLVLYGY